MNNYYYNISITPYDITNKTKIVNDIVSYFLARTVRMFRYEGLPDTIPQEQLELMLQNFGNVLFAKNDGKYYVYSGGLGGVPSEYYTPTQFIVSNPYQQLSKTFDIGNECVLINSDTLFMGLKPMLTRYATLISENEISMDLASINSRMVSLTSASTEREAESVRKYLKDVQDGKLGVIVEEALLDGIRVQPYATTGSSNSMIQLTEYEQYLVGSLYREIGLKGHNNMKRENISEAESQVGDETLLPLIDDMLECRKTAIDKINKMFGLNITVEKSSAWEYRESLTNQTLGESSDVESNEQIDESEVE